MEDIVSAFIVGTCRIIPKSNNDKPTFSMQVDDFKALNGCYTVVCGSCAEFFIQPLQTCTDDVDIFILRPGELVFTNEKPIYPYDIRHSDTKIECLLMEPYLDYPSFVRLRNLGKMVYNCEHKTYEFVKADEQTIIIIDPADIKFFRIDTSDEEENINPDNEEEWRNVGPALRKRVSDTTSHTFDMVRSVWCPQWPNEAKQWPLRRRNHGWPTAAIIREVVQNGCHVVSAKHRLCRNDKNQRRLSFSVAEVILIKSWTPVQQIVYHMLRFLAKRELIKTDCPKEDEVLCTYHFKTLMMWSCEEISREWWNSFSVINICCKLLEKLAIWLEEAICPNYFVPQANLFHEQFNRKIVDQTVSNLIFYSLTDNLSRWFVEHYLQPSFVKLLDENCTREVLSCEYLLKILEAIKANHPKFIDRYISRRSCQDIKYAHDLARGESKNPVADIVHYSLRFCSLWDDEFDFLPAAELESCYWFYRTMLRLLYAASLLESKVKYRGYKLWLGEVMRQVSKKEKHFHSRHHSLSRPLYTDASERQLHLIKAQDLMENLTGSNDALEFQLVSEISKRLLGSALDNERNESDSATLTYMAALYFATSEYRLAINLCSIVIMLEKTAEEETETLNACCLMYIEDISKIIGFYLIFLKTKDSPLYYNCSRQFLLDLRLTPQVFARYLLILSNEKTLRVSSLNGISQVAAFALDAILMAIANRKSSQNVQKGKNISLVCQIKDQMNFLESHNESCLPNEDDIIQLLMQYSLGYMASFYNAICTDFDIECSTVNCYRAACLYKCRKYPEVLHLCEIILNEPAMRIDLKEFAFANIMVLPPFDVYFDQDIQCLLGLYTLLCNLFPSMEVSETSTLEKKFPQELLSRVLLKSYSNKCHYFLGRHFLARYLKVRCLIDCNNLISEVEYEFNALKGNLPFENIIRCFLEQKLYRLQRTVDAKD